MLVRGRRFKLASSTTSSSTTTSSTTTSSSTTTTTTVVSSSSTTTTTTTMSGNTAYLLGMFGQSNTTQIASPFEYWSPYKPEDILTTEKMWTGSSFSTLTIDPFGLANNSGNGLTSSDGRVMRLATVDLPLMRLLASGLDDNIYAVKHAVGGTTLHEIEGDDWDADSVGELLDTFLTKMQAAKAKLLETYDNVVVWLYWGQGESDAWDGRTQSEYLADLNDMYSKVCTQLSQSNIPIALMKIHVQNSGASTEANQEIQLAVQEFADAAPSYRKAIGIDTHLFRDNYHFFADTYIQLAEEAAELYLGTTITNTTPPSDFDKVTMWRSAYPWFYVEWPDLTGINYYGQGARTRNIGVINGVGARITLKNPGGMDLSLWNGDFGFQVAINNVTQVLQAKYIGTTVYTGSMPPSQWVGLNISAGGVVSLITSTNGTTFTTLYTWAETSTEDWYVDLSSFTSVGWEDFKII